MRNTTKNRPELIEITIKVIDIHEINKLKVRMEGVESGWHYGNFILNFDKVFDLLSFVFQFVENKYQRQDCMWKIWALLLQQLH